MKKAVHWWTDECVKERNKALRMLRITHNFQNLIKYKQAQANVGKVKAKRQSWQAF